MLRRGLPSPNWRAWHRFGRLSTRVRREGASALAYRKLLKISALLAERLHLWRWRESAWVGDDRPVFLMISHRCGGGTERHIGDLATRAQNRRRSSGRCASRSARARPLGRARQRWRRGLAPRDGRQSSIDRANAGELGPSHAHVHHSLGLPEALFDALAERGVTYDWTIHDYHSICPRINLIGAGGRYCGEPDEAGCNRCLARLGDDQRPAVRGIDRSLARAEAQAGWRRPGESSCPVRMLPAGSSRYFPDRRCDSTAARESLPRWSCLGAAPASR